MKTAKEYNHIPNYVYDDSVFYNDSIEEYTVIHYDNGITEYIFKNDLPDKDKTRIIDIVTLFPFV